MQPRELFVLDDELQQFAGGHTSVHALVRRALAFEQGLEQMEQRTAHVREAPACRVLQRERTFDDAVHVDLDLCIRRIRRPNSVMKNESLNAHDSGNQISPRRPNICRTFAFALGRAMTLKRSLPGSNRTMAFAPKSDSHT